MMDENEQEGAQRFYNKCCSFSFNNIILRLHLHILLAMVILLSFFLTFTSYKNNNNNNYHYHLYAFVLPLFAHTFEKKYLFILCTTILTFITKKNAHLGMKEDMHHDKLLYALSEMDGATILEENLQECEYGKLDEHESKEAGDGKLDEPNMEDNENESKVLMEDEEGDGEVIEEEGVLSGSPCLEEEHVEMNMDTEELNKKIEEFIRKMKEELRIQVEQYLIPV